MLLPLPCPLRPAVGMEISFGLLFAKFRTIMLGITMLIAGKVAIMAAVGQVSK